MNKTLGEISIVSTGFSFRGPVPENPLGDTLVVQASDLNEDGSLAEMSHLKRMIGFFKTDSNNLLKGDVLLVTRGTPSSGFKAAYVTHVSSFLIASSSLAIIRMKDKDVLPEFLSIYLNTPKAQQQLQRIASGSTIRTLLTKNLSLLEIPIPPIETQRTIIELVRNVTSQKKLLQQRNSLLNELISSIVIKKSE